MAATPYSGTIIITYEDGANAQYSFTASDVADESWTFADGSTKLNLENKVAYITDIILTSAGVDTTKSEVWANSKNSGVVVLNSVNLSTTVTRQFAAAPLGIKAGATLQFIQKA